MNYLEVTQGPDALDVDVRTEGSTRLKLRLARTGGYETDIDLAPPSPLYYECAPESDQKRDAIVFAFLDFELDGLPEEIEAWFTVELDSPDTTVRWTLNDWARSATGECRQHLRIPLTLMRPWENAIHLRGSQIAVRTCRFELDVPPGDHSFRLRPRHRRWGGRLELVRDDATVVAHATLAARDSGAKYESGRVAANTGREEASVCASTLALRLRPIVRALLDARVPAGEPLEHGFHLVYDRLRRSYRVPHWIWAWGPVMRFLLDAAPIVGSAASTSGHDVDLVQAAHAAGVTSLGYFEDDPLHPAHDISTVRWYQALNTPGGSIRYASLADSLFLAGWGWMPLYRATGDRRYLDATQRLVERAAELLERYVIPPQDYVFECAGWTPHTLDESGFAMVGFEQLYAATGDSFVLETGRRFIDRHLDAMLERSPFWGRIYHRDDGHLSESADVKGHGWIMDAYLSAYGLTADSRYLDLARSLAAETIACQATEGWWSIWYRSPRPDDHRDDKATAIWAYQLARLNRIAPSQSYVTAAGNALAWCDAHMEGDAHDQGYGSMINTKPMASMTARPMAILYSTTYHGLARLELEGNHGE